MTVEHTDSNATPGVPPVAAAMPAAPPPDGPHRRPSARRWWIRMTQTPRARAVTAAVFLTVLLSAVGIVWASKDDDAPTTRSATVPGAEEGHREEDGEHHEEDGPARVTLTQAAFATAQIDVTAARVGAAALVSPGLDVPGEIAFDPARVQLVSPRTDGRIERLAVVEGDRVAAGQIVALVQSKEFLVAQSDLQQAARRAAVLAGGPDAAGANALLQAARRRLTILGVGSGDVARIEGGGEQALYLPLRAPLSGTVMKAHVLTGQAVSAGESVFTVADLSVVDVVAAVQERSAPLVRPGQAATVTLNALPSLPLKGRVERLHGELNEETRTVQAVIHVANPTGQLRPGMFATVRIAVPTTAYPGLGVATDTTGAPGAGKETVVTIPESAVVTDGEARYVFVRVAPLVFERRQVDIAPVAPAGSATATSAYVVVRGGVRPGEMVVSRGAFTLKSELAKASLGEHGH